MHSVDTWLRFVTETLFEILGLLTEENNFDDERMVFFVFSIKKKVKRLHFFHHRKLTFINKPHSQVTNKPNLFK